MQQKITNVFQNLLRMGQNPALQEQEQIIQRQQEAQSLEDAIRKDFRNLKWTRVISLHDEEQGLTRTWDMAPDIIAELQQMAGVDEELLAIIEPHFDPVTFQEVTTNPKIEEYRLDPGELQQWGVLATSIRK